ncbi:hypothetical protein BKA93DRAFT_778894 [Sparassis latifolia]
MSNNSTELRQFRAIWRTVSARDPKQPVHYCDASNAALVLYYNVLILAQERECIWRRRKFTGVTMLYLMNKFGSIGWAISNLLSIPNWSSVNVSLSGLALLYVSIGFTIITGLTSTVFDSLRVYAVGGRSWRYAAVVAVLNSTFLPQYICLGVYIGYTFDLQDVSNTIRLITDTPELLAIYSMYVVAARRATMVNWACSVIADLIVLFVTWSSTYKIKRDADRVKMKAPLATLLLRDGKHEIILFFISDIITLVASLNDTFYYVDCLTWPSVYTSLFGLPITVTDIISTQSVIHGVVELHSQPP